MHFSTLKLRRASTLNGVAGLIDLMALADRIKEAMGTMKPGAFAKEVNVTPGAVTQLLDGTTKSLRAETVVLIEQKTGYRASWIVTGKGPKKLTDGMSQEERRLLSRYREVLQDLKAIPEPRRLSLLEQIQQAANETREAAEHIARLDMESAQEEDAREEPTAGEEELADRLRVPVPDPGQPGKRRLLG